MKNWNLARRDLLKSLGAGAACLPLLNAGRAHAQAGNDKKKLVILQMSEGLRIGAWRPPTGSLTGGMLPKSNAGFEAHKADMIYIPNMNNPGGGGGHGSYGCAYYGLGGTGGGQYKEPTGATLDQVVARKLPKPTSGHLSLNLHVQLERAPRSTTMPGGSKCFWTGGGQPINPIGDPYSVYKSVFGGADTTNPNVNEADVKKLMLGKKSILDYLGKSLTQFGERVGNEDRKAIEGHLTSIRELEMQLSSGPVDAGKCGGAPGGMIDLSADASYPLIMKAHLGLITAALKCGITKVATLQTGDSSGNNINFGAFVMGLPARSKNNYKSPFRNWHDLGHNPVMDGVDHKQIVDKWFFDEFGQWFTQLKAAPDVGGSMLWDNVVVVIGNHVEDGGSHNSNAIPWMLAGKGGDKMNYGQCLGGGGPIKRVMAGICQSFGIMDHPYGEVFPGLLKG
jgi:hypothetical protein